jgi:hypothetical protein
MSSFGNARKSAGARVFHLAQHWPSTLGKENGGGGEALLLPRDRTPPTPAPASEPDTTWEQERAAVFDAIRGEALSDQLVELRPCTDAGAWDVWRLALAQTMG